MIESDTMTERFLRGFAGRSDEEMAEMALGSPAVHFATCVRIQNKDNEPIGTRIFGPVARELRGVRAGGLGEYRAGCREGRGERRRGARRGRPSRRWTRR